MRDVPRRPMRAHQPVHVAEIAPPPEPLTELDRDVAAAARQVPEVAGDDLALMDDAGGDDLALATEVAAAVETETDEDPEWAQLARGPEAVPGERKPEPPEPGSGPKNSRD